MKESFKAYFSSLSFFFLDLRNYEHIVWLTVWFRAITHVPRIRVVPGSEFGTATALTDVLAVAQEVYMDIKLSRRRFLPYPV
jgi:hypothetical protein